MNSKTISKCLIETCIKGDFAKVLKLISNNSVDLETHLSVKMLIACCNACHSSLPTDSFNAFDLVKLVKLLIKAIQTPSMQEYESYLQSAFYIVKCLQERERHEDVLELQELCSPTFMPLILNEKQKITFENVCKLIYNAIIRLASVKELERSDVVLNYCYFLANCYTKIGNLIALFETSYNCLVLLVKVSVSSESLFKFYCFVVQRVDDAPTLYPLLVKNASFIITHWIKEENFVLANQTYELTLQTLELFKGREFQYLNEVFHIVGWINPFDAKVVDLSLIHERLKYLYEHLPKHSSLQAVCDCVSSVAFVACLYHKKAKTWLKILHELQCCYYSFLYDISHIMSKTFCKCHCKTCPTNTNLNESLRCLNTIMDLAKLTICNRKLIGRTYKMEILTKYVHKYQEEVIILKNNKCLKWDKFWYCLGATLYTIGTNLVNKNDTEVGILYLKKFIAILLEIEGSSSKIVDKAYLNLALTCISEAYIETKEYEKSLLATALNITYCDCPKNAINLWIKAKVACRESTISENAQLQGLTLVSIFEKSTNELNTYMKNQPEIDEIKLLRYELRSYKHVWKSKLPMMMAFKQLAKIADARTSAEIFIDTWGDCDLQVHNSIPTLLHYVTKRLEGAKVAQAGQLLAHLYFLQHKYQMKDTITKHRDEMERTMAVIEEANEKTINGPPDPNEKCDIFSSYEALKITKYIDIVNNLNRSVELVKKDGLKPGKDVFRLLAMIGHEYHLHNQVAKAKDVWELALSVADSDGSKLDALGFLLETSKQNENLKKIMPESESKLDSLDCTKVSVYFLGKTKAYFYVDLTQALEAFTKAKTFASQSTNLILKARIRMMEHLFSTLPCYYGLGNCDAALIEIHQAYNDAINHYNEFLSGKDSAYDLRIVLEINQVLVRMYHGLRMPREVRCYCKEAVILAQKLVLPLRVLQCLYYLAYADISCCRLDDCKVKVQEIGGILGFDHLKSPMKLSPKVPSKKKKVPFDLDIVVDEFKEMTLNVPMAKNPNSGSPILPQERFKLPSFLSHDATCTCFYCTCIEYQNSVLCKTLIWAMLYERQRNISISEEYFRGALLMCQRLNETNSEIFCIISLEYGNFLERRGRFHGAKKLNFEAIKLMESTSLKLESPYLYSELVFQDLNIALFEEGQTLEQSEQDSESVDLNTAILALTPPTNRPKEMFSPFYRPLVVENVVLKPKSLKFDFMDSDDDEKTSGKCKITALSTKKKKVLKTPQVETPVFVDADQSTRRTTRSTKKGGENVKQNLLGKMNEDGERHGAVKKYARNRI